MARPSAFGSFWIFWLSAILGVAGGLLALFALEAPKILSNPSELGKLPGVLVAYSLIGSPIAALGLANFGLPATFLLRRYAQKPWLGVVAVVCGAIAGKLTFLLIGLLTSAGGWSTLLVTGPQPDLLCGATTGLALWALYRRRLDRAPPARGARAMEPQAE